MLSIAPQNFIGATLGGTRTESETMSMAIKDELDALRTSRLVAINSLLGGSSLSTTFSTPETEAERLRLAMLACRSRSEVLHTHGYIDKTRQRRRSTNSEAWEALRKHGYSDAEALRLCDMYRRQDDEEENAERDRIERSEWERLAAAAESETTRLEAAELIERERLAAEVELAKVEADIVTITNMIERRRTLAAEAEIMARRITEEKLPLDDDFSKASSAVTNKDDAARIAEEDKEVDDWFTEEEQRELMMNREALDMLPDHVVKVLKDKYNTRNGLLALSRALYDEEMLTKEGNNGENNALTRLVEASDEEFQSLSERTKNYIKKSIQSDYSYEKYCFVEQNCVIDTRSLVPGSMCEEEKIKHVASEINIQDENTTMTMASDCIINDDSDSESFKEFLMFAAIDGSETIVVNNTTLRAKLGSRFEV